MNVFGWLAGHDGCSFYRMEEPLRCASERGGWGLELETDLAGSTFDFLVAQRTVKGPPSMMLRSLIAKGVPTVYEIDDLIWNLDRTNPAWDYYSGDLERHQMQSNLRAAPLITVTNEALARETAKVTRSPIWILPNFVPERLITAAPAYNHHHDDKIRIGYPASGSHMTDVHIMKNGLRKLLKKHRNVEFVSIGADFRPELRVEGTHVLGNPSVEGYYELLDFDILVAPLAPTRFNACKSHIKVLESAARGIPCVASNFGPYAEWVQHGEDGFLASNDDEWFQFLRELLDPEVRAEMGGVARERAKWNTYEDNADLWVKAYSSL